ncbi:uncharacterized protein MELLADRAFT_115879 [Melampsora larici-populina 98AG31]|uniref:NTF2 domain-containing protein n=1 Tax=Melampsora larici-populina (strain 98AG31 / pathotype 3-4-7) TaxID=747676 RepID=F4RFB2_MELLP|nr:uncharacterized protein MELLADRAFT_115879 [Melampsora larici-populina 98AG31]EGG08966.1 hypothetical protein MELLADRAFT_115879 [Melampsora larici-populina 98AG31]
MPDVSRPAAKPYFEIRCLAPESEAPICQERHCDYRLSRVNAGLYSIFPSKLNQSFMTSQGIPDKPTFLDLRTRPLPSFCAQQSPSGPQETQSASRRSQQTYPSTVKREDAQPNEGNWVPYRLRRPAQPPSIRPISSIPTNQKPFHQSTGNRSTATPSRYHEASRTQGPSHFGRDARNQSGSNPPRQFRSQITHGDVWRSDRQNSIHLHRVNPPSSNRHHDLPLRLDCPIPSSSVVPTTSLPSQPREVQPLTRSPLTTLTNESEATPVTRHQHCQSPPAIQSNTTSPLTFRRDPTCDDVYNSMCRKRPFLGNASSSCQQPLVGQAGAKQRPETPQETGSRSKKPRYNTSSNLQPVRNTNAIASFPMVIVRATLRPGLSMDKCLVLTRCLLGVYGTMQVLYCTLICFLLWGGIITEFTGKVEFENPEDAYEASQAKLIIIPNDVSYKGLKMSVKLYRSHDEEESSTQDLARLSPVIVEEGPPKKEGANATTDLDIIEMDQLDPPLSPGTPPQFSSPGTPPQNSSPRTPPQISSPGTPPLPQEDAQFIYSSPSPAPSNAKDQEDCVREPSEGDNASRQSSISGDTDMKIETSSDIEIVNPKNYGENDHETASSEEQEKVDITNEDIEQEIIEDTTLEGDRQDSLCLSRDSSPTSSHERSLRPMDDIDRIIRKAERKADRKAASADPHCANLTVDPPVVAKDVGETTHNPTSGPSSLPLYEVAFAYPKKCEVNVPDYLKSRHLFELEKVRTLTQEDKRVMTSSWADGYLILRVIDNRSLDGSESSQDIDQLSDGRGPSQATQAKATQQQPTLAASISSSVEAGPSHHSRNSALEPIDLCGDRHVASRSTQHPKWPFAPKATYVDESVHPDLRRSLHDFLSTFFRLWEESRVDLRHLYDQTAIFSNLLAKQGCTSTRVTKNIGWSSIYYSISRLPALSNEPLDNLIVDAWPVPTDPKTVLCIVHGAFAEFPKNIQRAFDRCFVLRPVDTNRDPSEGCLGLIKWIILSDTLTIRKHTVQTNAIISGFNAQCTLTADRLRSVSRSRNKGGQASSTCEDHHSLPSNRRSNQVPPVHDASRPQKTLDQAPQAQRAGSPPALLGDTPIPHDVAIVPAPLIADLTAQLRELRSEIDQLKNRKREEANMRQLPPARPPQRPNQPFRPQPNDSFRVRNTFAYTHRGFGVTKKRYLVPTDMNVHLNVSLRGDVLSWDKRDRSKVQLLLPGPSATEIVDAACYSAPHKTLILGSRSSNTGRSYKSSQVSLIKFNRPAKNEKQIMLWKAVNGKVDVIKRFTEHKSAIQAPTNEYITMVTTGNKTPDYQFRLCDIRGNRPAINFGFGEDPNFKGFESPVETYRKGGIRDNYFVYPDGQVGGLKIWDLRSTRGQLMKVGTSVGIHALFESRKTVVLLEKETLRYIEFQ